MSSIEIEMILKWNLGFSMTILVPLYCVGGRAENSLTRSDGEILFLAFFGDFYHWGIAECRDTVQ